MRSWRLGGVLVTFAVSGLGAAQADEQDQRRISQITDPRVVEASGMALSTRVPDLAYIVNDSGNDPVVFSIRVSTGEVIGTTTLVGVEPEDTEALAIGPDGRLWVADIGDNAGSREEVALLALPQPTGSGDETVEPTVQRVRYAGGPVDAEGLLVDPRTGRFLIATKGAFGGRLLSLPASLLTDPDANSDAVAVARPEDVTTPGLVTDAAVLPDGSGAVLRTYTDLYVYALPDWRLVGRRPLPQTRQGETLAVQPGGRSALVGSEGTPSPLLRVLLPADALAALEPRTDGDADEVGEDGDPALAGEGGNGGAGGLPLWPLGGLALLGLAGLGWRLLRGRWRSRTGG